jgi:UDP-glucose 4-epimerase
MNHGEGRKFVLPHDSYHDRTVLVTGAAGFIGSHLTERLLDLGARVRAADRLELAACASLAPVRDDVEYRRCELAGDEPLDDLVAGCDVVFHLAGNADAGLSVAQPSLDFSANVTATFNVIDATRRTGAGTMLFASTATVYGEPERVPMNEEHPLRPQTPYAGHKLAAEVMIEAHGRCFGLDVRRVRLFNTYGPRQNKYVMFDILEKLRRNPRRLEVLGTGKQVRTYNYIADTVDALLLAAVHPQARATVLNIAGRQPVSIGEMVDLIIAAAGIEQPEIVYTGQSWEGDVMRLYGSSERLSELGFEPRVDLAEGIRRLVAWHRTEYSPPW